MSRRIDVELTSDRGDGTWTWRAAGAKQPRGDVDGALLPAGASTGDVLRAEADFGIDGITIVSVVPPKAGRKEPERIEILGSGRDEAGVTTSLAGKKGGGRGRGDKGRGRGRDGGDRKGRRPRGGTPPPPERPKKPKPPRLRTKRTHRDAALAELADAERPVGEQVLKGGVPAVREALRDQNEENRKAGRPPVTADAVVGLAEQLLPRLKAAEWHDRADAAVEQMDTVDLRDLRSVVTAAEVSARDDETRALADELRQGLAARVEHDHAAWLQELSETLADGRVACALNLSSRPPKAGAPLPRDFADRLAAAASAALTSEVGQKRWQTVLESVARSPVRQHVVPEGVPASPNDELLETVRNLSMQVPQIAAAFDIEPQRPSRKRRSRKPKGRQVTAPPKPEATTPNRPGAARIPPPPDLAGKEAEEPEPTAEPVAPAGEAEEPGQPADEVDGAAPERVAPAGEAEEPGQPADEVDGAAPERVAPAGEAEEPGQPADEVDGAAPEPPAAAPGAGERAE